MLRNAVQATFVGHAMFIANANGVGADAGEPLIARADGVAAERLAPGRADQSEGMDFPVCRAKIDVAAVFGAGRSNTRISPASRATSAVQA